MHFFRTILSFLKNEEYRDLLFTTVTVIVIGTVAYHYIEGWRFIDALYFSVVTLTTIGFGDLSPKTDTGKLFTIFYIVIGIGVILQFINTLQNHYAQSRPYRKRKNN
ncbi:potassium channel family protein [Flavobacterium rhizosphaerae]|uniref:Potassium channel family protein n=1 Tax=Flavobacterium rhizosphaerae TaxID=3163298 RepID=A0ABW8YTU6_9FLAO